MDLVAAYPACMPYADGSNLDQVSAVLADMGGASAVNAGAALNVNFGMALWLAFALHAVGVEVYVSSLPTGHRRHITNSFAVASDTQRGRALEASQLHKTARGWYAQSRLRWSDD